MLVLCETLVQATSTHNNKGVEQVIVFIEWIHGSSRFRKKRSVVNVVEFSGRRWAYLQRLGSVCGVEWCLLQWFSCYLFQEGTERVVDHWRVMVECVQGKPEENTWILRYIHIYLYIHIDVLSQLHVKTIYTFQKHKWKSDFCKLSFLSHSAFCMFSLALTYLRLAGLLTIIFILLHKSSNWC